jgi:PKD repeat protein
MAAPALGGGANWYSSDWQYRRELKLGKYTPSGLAGDDVAVFTMSTGGLCKADGSDIRVATNSLSEVPTRVLLMGPGDEATVAFALQPGVSQYYVYFGHAKPPAGKPLEIKRGVVMETWSYDGGELNTLEEAKNVFKKSRTFIGRGVRDRVFLGFNPFGPQNKIATIFTGYFQAAKGKHVFALSSNDASFLLVDDNVVVKNPGIHPPQGDVSKQGAVELEAGLHKLTVYHVNVKGHPVAVAAWQPPDAKSIQPMPESAFAPVVTAIAGGLEQYGREIAIDFVPVHSGELYLENNYYQRYTFEALPGPKSPGGAGLQWEWDFGDGIKSTQQRVEHIYLTDGPHTVTLTAKASAGPAKRTNKIEVTRPWSTLIANKLDAWKDFTPVIAGYDFAALQPPALAQAVCILGRQGDNDSCIRAGNAMLAAATAPADVLDDAMSLYAQALRRAKQGEKAPDAYARAAKLTNNPAVCAAMLVEGGKAHIELGSKDNLRAAEAMFEEVGKKYEPLTTAPPMRAAKIGLGDVWRARGDLERAREAYARAKVGPEAQAGREAVIRGDFARHIEDYIRKNEFWAADEYLARWETTYPLDKLEGYWSLLKVQCDMARKRFAPAAAEAQTLATVNPASNFGAELLMLAADCHTQMQRPDKAAAAYKQVVEQYPESPLAKDAAQKAKAAETAAATRPAASRPSSQPAAKGSPASAPAAPAAPKAGRKNQ